MGVLRRIDADDLEEGRRFLADCQALALDLLGQQRDRELGAVLDVDRVDVRIGAEREGDGQRIAAVGAARGLVIERMVDTVDLLLDGLRDGRLHHLRVGTRVKRREGHLRRYDLRKLRHRNGCDREDAGERNHDRNDERKPRPVDKKIGDHLSALVGNAASCTTWPARTFCIPSTITFSPSCRPEVTTTSVAWFGPVWIRRCSTVC